MFLKLGWILLNRKLLVPVHVDSYVNCNPCNDTVMSFCCSVYVFNVSCELTWAGLPWKRDQWSQWDTTWINKGLKWNEMKSKPLDWIMILIYIFIILTINVVHLQFPMGAILSWLFVIFTSQSNYRGFFSFESELLCHFLRVKIKNLSLRLNCTPLNQSSHYFSKSLCLVDGH